MQFLARPILAFKRDLSRPTSETRVPVDQEPVSSYRTRQESSSSSSPLEIIDIDTSGSIKSLFDKVKNTLTPSTKRRTSDNSSNDERNMSTREIPNSSNKNAQNYRLHHHKSVSFAENVDNDSDSDEQYSTDDRNQIVRNAHTLANQILMESIDEATMKKVSNNSDDNFQRDFHRTIKPGRMSSNDVEDLVYQDLSAEIAAYILKHALRTLKKEHEELVISTKNERIINQNEQDDDFIDLK